MVKSSRMGCAGQTPDRVSGDVNIIIGVQIKHTWEEYGLDPFSSLRTVADSCEQNNDR